MIRIIFSLLLLFSQTLVAAKPVKIVMWHSLAGHLGTQIRQLVRDFNHSQPDYVIEPVYKGDYIESLTSFAAAFRAGQPPDLVQVSEVGTATMLSPKGIVKPVDELMKEQGMSLPEDDFLPALRAFYSRENRLMAMPFNTSVPVMYYNADALRKVGYFSGSFPETWDELEILAGKLRKAGYSCAYTSAYPGWIFIESFSAIHGLPMTNQSATKATYNNKPVIHHLERLKRWQKLHYFEYGGRTSDSTVLFTSGRCPLFSQSSGSYMGLAGLVKFNLGVARLPLDKNVSLHRYNNVTGGAALWAVSGKNQEVYRGIAYFLSYLSKPEVQQRWHQETGYLPIGMTGIYKKLKASDRHAALEQSELAQKQRGLAPLQYLGPQNQIRTINDKAIELIFAGIQTPQQAIDGAVKRADHALLRFVHNTQF